jgi:hypothetical protein
MTSSRAGASWALSDRLYEIPAEGLREAKRRREREEAEEIGGGPGWREEGTGIEAEVVAWIEDWWSEREGGEGWI